MDKVKVFGVILGIAGLAFILFILIGDLTSIFDEQHYSRWETSIFCISAILASTAFTLGSIAITTFREKKAPYLMILTTITETLGFAPLFYRFARLEMNVNILVLSALIFILPTLGSAILLAIPTKPHANP